jgi:S1-C subfamily serine protease
LAAAIPVRIHPVFIAVCFHVMACEHNELEDDMDLDFRVADEAAKRWWARQQQREARRSAIDAGRVSDVESPERIKKRIDRLTEATLKRKVERSGAGVTPRAMAVSSRQPSLLMETIGLERVLGKSDFLGTDFLEMVLTVSRFVGRINIRARPGRTVGFGTGFMVSPRLLLTNNHVLQSGRDAL